MKSRKSGSNKTFTWQGPIEVLAPRSAGNASLQKLATAGITSIQDLLWILPLRMQKAPELQRFDFASEGQLFLGEGKILSLNFRPAYGRKGKGNVRLFNIDAVVQDLHSTATLFLKWFNAYPNMKKILDQNDTITFRGEVQILKGVRQITNPVINKSLETNEKVLIEYPTINTISGKYIKGLIDKIPDSLWMQDIPSSSHLLSRSRDLSLVESFRILHGRSDILGSDEMKKAKERLIYEEFFLDQLKIYARRKLQKSKAAPVVGIANEKFQNFIDHFPYKLTEDQIKATNEIREDLLSGHPMMRILQGDVGCGKTTVAMLASLISALSGKQVAIMCPTETLARQHADTFGEFLQKFDLGCALLLGSTKTKQKKLIYDHLKNGDIKILIGTHALIQESVEFQNLGLCIIDEQHKFGVEQRLKLANKGKGAHSLIMTATPIPRTLQLAQYGDLDISTIKTIPSGRKGTKTRIVSDANYEKYLSFVKTRLTLGEQVYVVVPAIDESESIEMKNVKEVEDSYRKYFPEFQVASLHGQLKADDKDEVLKNFKNKKIQILVSTSVIEVGINVINATIMSVYDPNRFGLSSLHQLRGRVGRGQLPGFFFLIASQKFSAEAFARLRVLEKTTDGFEIAEADLKNRGEGDVFGVDQSGNISNKKVASIFEHFDMFQKVSNDFKELEKIHPQKLLPYIKQVATDTKISITI